MHTIYLLLFIFLTCTMHVALDTLEEDCVDRHGNKVLHGTTYIPGPNVCTTCICHHSKAAWCRSIFCEPPYYCKKFRIGKECCEYECLDSKEEIAAEKERLAKRRKQLGISLEGSDEDTSTKNTHMTYLIVCTVILTKLI